MKAKYFAIIGSIAVFCGIAACSLFGVSAKIGNELIIPMMIHVGLPLGEPYGADAMLECAYYEVLPDVVQRLNLSVESCEGLTEVGKVIPDTSDKTTSRLVFDEAHPEGFKISVTIPDVAYAYPDSRYPNLLVAMVEGEPVIFEFIHYSSAPSNPTFTEHFQSIYGNLSVEKLRIQIEQELGEEAAQPEITITDPAAIAEFCEAFHALRDSNEEERKAAQSADFKSCEVIVDCSNGFSFNFVYSSIRSRLHIAWRDIPSNDALDAWFATYVK